MKPRVKSRGRRKITTKAIARKRPRLPRSRSANALDHALRQLKQAVGITVSRADSVLGATEAIVQLATRRTKAHLVSSLLEDEVLTALYGLPQSESAVLALRLYSRWLKEHLGLESIYEQGQILEVPGGRLSAFDLVDGAGRNPRGIVAIRIVAAGWKQDGKLVRKPLASLAEGPVGEKVT